MQPKILTVASILYPAGRLLEMSTKKMEMWFGLHLAFNSLSPDSGL